MNRPYTAHSPYSLSPTERIRTPREDLDDYEDYDDYQDDGDEDYDDYQPIDRRWIWVAGAAGAILLVAVICTVVILGGGDSGSVSTTVNSSIPPVTTSAPTATTTAPPAATTPSAPSPAPSLTPETVTTLSPSPTAAAPPSVPVEVAPPPRSVTYTVTGNRQFIDLVTVIYTDQQGALQTDVNVALPWSRTVVLDPGVELSSVTATSVGGQLNCSITDASGAAIAVQNNNSMITTCTK